jgi:signal transduction histidine kinase
MGRKKGSSTSVDAIRFLISLLPTERGQTEFSEKLQALTKDRTVDDHALVPLYHELVQTLERTETRTVAELKSLVRDQFLKRVPKGIVVLALPDHEALAAFVSAFIESVRGRLEPLVGRATFDRAASIQEMSAPALAATVGTLYALAASAAGARSAQKGFEAAYRETQKRFDFSPVIHELLSCMPPNILHAERSERMRELESLVDTRARELSWSNQRLTKQAQVLSEKLDELREVNARLTRLDLARQDFIRVVSHQFRTPLSAIRWHTDSLREGLAPLHPPTESLELINNIAIENRYLVSALEKVLLALDIDTGNLKLIKKRKFFWEIVQDALEDQKAIAEDKRVTLSYKKGSDALVEIPVDPEKIKLVVEIVLTNAVTYTKPEGSVKLEVKLGKIDGAPALAFRCEDTGIGMDADDLEHVFDKFFRSAEAVRIAPNGTGLGMYIAKEVVEAHGGTVTVRSQKNKGTEVTLLLPLEETS